MNAHLGFRKAPAFMILCVSMALVAQTLAAASADNAAPPAGYLRGVTVDAAGKPLAGAHVNIHSSDGADERELLSGSDGTFNTSALRPGTYRLTASKGELGTEGPVAVVIAPNETSNASLKLAAADPPTSAPTPAVAPAPGRASAPAPLTEREAELLARIDRLEERLAAMEAAIEKPVKAASSASAPAATVAKTEPPAAPAPAAAAPAPAAPAPQTPPAPAAPTTPEALQAPDPAPPGVDNVTPFAYGDFTWLNGTPRNKDTVLDTKYFTPEVRFDTSYMEDFNQPIDHTIVGATESFRSGEVQIEQASVGGDFHWQNVRGRVLFMFGLFSTTTPRNDASAGVGNWDLRGAYKYVSEAYGGYHFNVNHGLNVDAGIFVSYIGLFSYYNFDNWTYQPSYVSSNTPWFFNGVRVQWYPTNKLKIEPWFINGWQSYAKYNGHPGLGGQLLWEPKEWLKVVANQYGYGQDNLGLPHTERLHTDDSIEVRYYSNPSSLHVSKMAFSLTADAGCQYGGGIQCTGAPSKNKDSFVGWMMYQRVWFHKDLWALTFGGGEMSNWGRYLTLLPPINGADAVTGSPYFTQLPGQRAHMWDSTVTLQYMPKQYITWWGEVGYRHSDVPYFAGRGGVTPPGFALGGTNGAPGQFACMNGAPSGASDLPTATTNCSSVGGVWFPDLRRSEAKISLGVMVKF